MVSVTSSRRPRLAALALSGASVTCAAVYLSAGAAVGACSSDDQVTSVDATDSGDAGAAIDSGSSLALDSGSPLDASCNSLAASGEATVTTSVVDAEAPVATGGTIVDGTYELLALDWYMGDPLDQLPPMATTTLVISGGGTTWQLAGTGAGGAYTLTYAVTVDGNRLTLNEVCPDPDDAPLVETYAASETTLSVFDEYEGEPYVRVYQAK